MNSIRLLVTVVSLAVAVQGCSIAVAQEAVPNDSKDDRPALQAQIDQVSRQGGGIIQLERGTYDLGKALFLRSGVTLKGRGPETVLTNARFNPIETFHGTTIFAGNMTPASYWASEGRGYGGMPVQARGDRTVVGEACDEARFASMQGDVVWISSEAGIKAANGQPKPEWGALNFAKAVRGCQVELADPIGIPENQRIFIHHADGSKQLPGLRGEPNRMIHDAGLSDMTIVSARAQAVLSSGCYRCTFSNLVMGRTRRLVPLEGARWVEYRNISGTFTERGIEIVMFTRDNIVDGINATYASGSGRVPRPGIRFGEFARGNRVSNVTLDLGPDYVGKPKIRFDASANNTLTNVEVRVPRADRRPVIDVTGTEGTQRVRIREETTLDDVRVCAEGRCDRAQ